MSNPNDSASTNDRSGNTDNGHDFFLNEKKGRWIRAQEHLGLVVRGPDITVKERGKNGRETTEPGPILNMDFIRSTMDLPRAVLEGRERDADTVLTEDPVQKEFNGDIPKKFKPQHSLGCSNTRCSARQLGKRAYHWLMFEGPDMKNATINPRTGEKQPKFELVKCAGYGNTKDKKSCDCSRNLRKLMHFDLKYLRKGAKNASQRRNAERIHKARWIGFLTKLLEKFLRIPLFADDQETLFTFLSVATPYCSASHQNAAPEYNYYVNGICIKGCHYLPCELLGHHYTYRRCLDFQSNFLSGLSIHGYKYVRKIYTSQKRNFLLWTAMIEISIENGGWPDFTPKNVAGPDNLSTSTIAKHLERKHIQIGSHDNENHVKGMLPYYSKLRHMLLAYRKSGYLLVSHPLLSSQPSLGMKDRQTSILLPLEGKESFEGLIHQANAGMAVISDCIPLLSAFYEAIVNKAGYSGRKNLDEVPPDNFRGKKATTPGDKKRKRSQSHKEVVYLSDDEDEEEKEEPQVPQGNYFLTRTDGCPHILQHGGELLADNCWEAHLQNVAGKVSDEMLPLCGTMHNLCINLCLHLLPKDKRRSLDSYNVQSSLTFTMNYRDLGDEDYCVEASHMEYSPAKLQELSDKGIYPFVGLVPLQSDGNFTRIHPQLDANTPDTMRGNVVFTPLGTLILMPASMIYGGGMRMGPNGNPCIKVHYFLSEKGSEDFIPLKTQDLGDYMIPLDHLTAKKKKKKKGKAVEGEDDVYFVEKHRVRMMAMNCLFAKNSDKEESVEAEGAKEKPQDKEAEEAEALSQEKPVAENLDATKGLFGWDGLKNLIRLFGS